MNNCGGSCQGCSGCPGRALTLTEPELVFLRQLGQIPFLPVARRRDDPAPVYLEGGDQAQMALVLQCLEKKGLVSLDYDQPLPGMDQGPYGAFPLRGSVALTARGQQVLELAEYQGVSQDTGERDDCTQ